MIIKFIVKKQKILCGALLQRGEVYINVGVTTNIGYDKEKHTFFNYKAIHNAIQENYTFSTDQLEDAEKKNAIIILSRV